jgi:hypothetical protein
VAQFVLTITSDSAEEIASFLSPPSGAKPTVKDLVNLTQQLAPGAYEKEILTETVEPGAKKRGRPAKTETASPTTLIAPSAADTTETPQTAEPAADTASSEITLADVKSLINQAVKVKPAKAVVDALTAECGTAAPGAMSPAQLAIAKTTLEGLLNG